MIRKGKEAKPKVANAANAKLNMPFSPFFCFALENDWVIWGFKCFLICSVKITINHRLSMF
jgi:hypothetical protein